MVPSGHMSWLDSTKHQQWEIFTKFKLNEILDSHLKIEGVEDGSAYIYRFIYNYNGEIRSKRIFCFFL